MQRFLLVKQYSSLRVHVFWGWSKKGRGFDSTYRFLCVHFNMTLTIQAQEELTVFRAAHTFKALSQKVVFHIFLVFHQWLHLVEQAQASAADIIEN